MKQFLMLNVINNSDNIGTDFMQVYYTLISSSSWQALASPCPGL